MAQSCFRYVTSHYKIINLPLFRYYTFSNGTMNARSQNDQVSYLQPLKSKTINIRSECTNAIKTTDEILSGCPICSRNLTFTYKDVLLLSQFISPEGNILNRRVSGVCRKQQRKLEKAIEISRRLGLIPGKPPVLLQQEM